MRLRPRRASRAARSAPPWPARGAGWSRHMKKERAGMSHVDEGTLHGYLDGQLTSMETVKLEAHLAECAQCRARLDEERELAQRALGILAHVAPKEEEIPPLVGVTSVPRRLWPRWMPAAWAASLLLALGAGWMMRGGSAPRQVGLLEQERVAADSVGDERQF